MDAYIVSGARTPRGRAGPKGPLAHLRPVDLIAPLFDKVLDGVARDQIADVILGVVHQTGEQGANLGKTIGLLHGLERASGATVNRFCASGLEAILQAALRVAAGSGPVLAGGVESLSRVPMFSDNGPWFADPDVARRSRYVHMAIAADRVAALIGADRAALDAVAMRSQARALAAPADDIVGIPSILKSEGCPRANVNVDSLSRLPFLFDGPHHAGTAPALADGASLLLIASAATPYPKRARIVAFGDASVDPELMLTGNVPAAHLALKRAGLTPADIDVWEINESFAAMPLHFARQMDLDPERLNVNGGAIALGHPLGATGGILVLTALAELERRRQRRALISICGGGGLALAMIIERA